jgi:MFS family permease
MTWRHPILTAEADVPIEHSRQDIPLSQVTDAELVYRKISWRLIPLLVFVFILAWLDRVNIGFAKLHMLSDLGFSEAVYGLGAGIFFIGYFIFEVPSNLLMARIGAKRTLGRIAILWGIVSTLMFCVHSVTSFYIVRFILGICEAGFFPGVILYLTYWFPIARRARANGLFMASFAVAGVVGGPLAGVIMTSMSGVGGLADWQWLFIIEGIPSVLTGLFILAYLPDGPEKAVWLTVEEKKRVARALESDSAASTGHHSFGSAMRSPRVWICTAIFFCLVAGNATLAFWVPSIIKAIGVKSVLNIGLISAIPFVAGTIAMIINASHSDKTNERRLHCAVAAIVAALGLAATGHFLSNGPVALLALTVAASGVLAAMPVFWSIPAAFLRGTASAGGIAVINCFANLAGFVAPFVIGSLTARTGVLSSGLYFSAGLECVAALLVLLLMRARKASVPNGRTSGRFPAPN